jgi:hypothetical protein
MHSSTQVSTSESRIYVDYSTAPSAQYFEGRAGPILVHTELALVALGGLENVVFWGYTNTVLASACTITTLLVVLAEMSLIDASKVGYLREQPGKARAHIA